MIDDTPKQKSKDKSKEISTWTWRRTGKVALAGVIYGIVMQWVFTVIPAEEDVNMLATLAFLAGVPLIGGGLSVRMIPPVRRTWFNIIAIVVSMSLTFLFFVIVSQPYMILCVLMASPFIVVIALIGAFMFKRLDRYFLNRKYNRSQLAFTGFVLVLPLLIAPVEANLESPHWHRNVQNEIIINATIEEVWDNIIRMDTIAPDEQRPSIYHSLGIPRPIKATLDYAGLGGVRVGHFEHGLTFVEEIIQWELYDSVRFNVDVQHNDQSTAILKHIGGRYFDILEAGYEIIDLGNDQVLLRLDSDYRLTTNFNGYGAFWSDWIMHDFQTYVLTTIKHRVEAQ